MKTAICHSERSEESRFLACFHGILHFVQDDNRGVLKNALFVIANPFRGEAIQVMKKPATYIMANKQNGTLYTGVTSNLIQRIYQHKNNMEEGFSKKLNRLIILRYTDRGVNTR